MFIFFIRTHRIISIPIKDGWEGGGGGGGVCHYSSLEKQFMSALNQN